MKTPVSSRGFRLLALLAALAAPGIAAKAPALTLEGRVYLGDTRKPVAGQSMQIHAVKGTEEQPGGSTTTDAQGRFKFTGLRSETGLAYYLATEYEGAYYTEGPIPSTGGKVERDIVVFEVGSDSASVSVSNHHVILEKQPDGYHVTEVLVFQNSGSKAYLGSAAEGPGRAGMRIGLPAVVKDFHVGMGGDEATTSLRGRELTSSRPIPPGMRPFSFTYHVPASGRVDLSHRFHFPTETFVVMLDDPKVKLVARQLEASGSREQGGKNYSIYTASGFAAGKDVAIHIESPSIWTNPTLWSWLAAPVLVAFVLWLSLRRGRRAQAVAATAKAHEAAGAKVVAMPAAGHAPAGGGASTAGAGAPGAVHAVAKPGEGASDEFAQVYLYLISALDQGSAKGDLPKEASELVRRNLKRRLEVVLSDGAARAKH
jgi:hypothetical protein